MSDIIMEIYVINIVFLNDILCVCTGHWLLLIPLVLVHAGGCPMPGAVTFRPWR